MTRCIAEGDPVDSLDPIWDRLYAEQGTGSMLVECPECGQEVTAEDSGSEEGHQRLNLPRHDVPDDPAAEEADAAAEEADRRFEAYRDDEITARHTGETHG